MNIKKFLIFAVLIFTASSSFSVKFNREFCDKLDKHRAVAGLKALAYGAATYISAKHALDTINAASTNRDQAIFQSIANAGVISLGMAYVSYLTLREAVKHASHALEISNPNYYNN